MSGLSSANLVEPDARGFDGVERLLLKLQRGWPFAGIRERAAGNRPVIPALGGLQRVDRRRMFGLPGEPRRQTPDRVVAGRTTAFNPEWFAGVLALGMRDPLSVALDGDEAVSEIADPSSESVITHQSAPG